MSSSGNLPRRTPILISTPYQPPPSSPPALPRISVRRWLPILILVILPVPACVWAVIAMLGDDPAASANAIVTPEPTPPAATPVAVAPPVEKSETPIAEPKVEAVPAPKSEANAKPAPPVPAPAAKVPQPAPPKIAVVPVKQLTEEQKRVNAAIDRGVEYLKKSQTTLGMWGPARANGHTVGHTALPGLALLECGVPQSDPVIQKAAVQVRFHANQVNMTYDLALAILFLDRLGDEKDVPLIQLFASRLIAAQNAAGGWHYHCPILQSADAKKLLNFLRTNQAKLPEMLKPAQKPADPIAPTTKPPDLKIATPITSEAAKQANGETKIIAPGTGTPSDSPASKKDAGKSNKKAGPARVDSLPPALQKLPIVLFNKKTGLFPIGMDDNSNTQFALLGLWAARRHGVPVEKSLDMADLRFQRSQNREGGWGYHVGAGTTPTMTCVGLLGLAMGHGNSEAQKKEDKAISQGLRVLGKVLENDFINFGRNEFYFLWSVERVGMLYNLNTIGGVDWYRWGTKIILPKQHGDGAWRIEPGYDPAIDTSFALLFLRRSNLVQDLSNRLQLYLAITDPAAPSRR